MFGFYYINVLALGVFFSVLWSNNNTHQWKQSGGAEVKSLYPAPSQVTQDLCFHIKMS